MFFQNIVKTQTKSSCHVFILVVLTNKAENNGDE